MQRVLMSYSEMLSSGSVRLMIVSDRDLAPALFQEAQQLQQAQQEGGAGGAAQPQPAGAGALAVIAAEGGGGAAAAAAGDGQLLAGPLPAVVIGAP